MTVIINGTDNSASTPAVTGTDGDTGMFYPAANTVALSTGGSERMRVDSSGNVGIGVTPFANTLGKSLDLVNGVGLFGSGNNTYLSANAYYDSDWKYKATDEAAFIGLESGSVRFNIAASGTAANNITFTEAARIDSSGNLLVGTTSGSEKLKVVGTAANFSSPSGSCVVTIAAENASGANADLVLLAPGSNSSTLRYDRNNGQLRISVGSTANGVSLANGGTSWGSFSDERLKDIIEPIENASEKVSSLRAVIGRYKTDEPEKRRAFLIAQDVRAVLPEAVYQNNEEDDTLNLAYTDTIPLLVAAIQELKAINDAQAQRIETLEAKVAALEGAE
jgi:hypothetical protein